MFEADWTPSSWDDEDGQRRHLDTDTPTPAGSSTPVTTTTPTPPATTPAVTAAKKPVVTAPTKTDRKATLMQQHPICKKDIKHRKCPEFVRLYEECDLSKAKTNKEGKAQECWNGAYYDETMKIKSA